MGIPAAFALLASRSRFPEERAGDAQAVMALGRVFGPVLGGSFFAAGQTAVMGLADRTPLFDALGATAAEVLERSADGGSADAIARQLAFDRLRKL